MALLIVQMTLAPLVGGGPALVAAAAICVGQVVAAAAGARTVLIVVNDLTVLLLTVGVTNLWAQTGMTPWHVAALAAALTVYDTLATGVTTLTADFVGRFLGLPLAPVLAVQYGPSPIAIGLGDCLMLALWPLVADRVYGRAAALWALAVDAGLLAVLLAGFAIRVLPSGVPVLTPLGPLMVAQVLLWHRLRAGAGHPPEDPIVTAALDNLTG